MTLFTPPVLFEMTFIDVSQFVMEPLRTGVQRVLMKVIEHLPRERIMPFRVIDEFQVAILDPAIFDFGIRYFAQVRPAQRALLGETHGRPNRLSEEDLLIKLVSNHPVAILDARDFFARAERIINLEAFSRPARSLFYTACAPEHRAKVFHFIHDLLLFEAPEVFPQLNWRYASDYVLLFEAYCAAGGFFVASAEMARKVAHYFRRDLADIRVVHFGGDVVGKPSGRRAAAGAARRSVVVVGTIEPRKYPRIVAEALFRLAAYHPGLECILIGKFGWIDGETRAAIENIVATGHVTHHAHLADQDVTHLIEAADVGIYVSSHEGFGLPVIEFASLGVPIVTNDAVPAASQVGTQHATVLRSVDVRELVVAVEHRLAQARPTAPYYPWTWADCAREIFEWRDAGRRAQALLHDGPSCWQSCIRLVRDLRPRHLQVDELRAEVRRFLATDPQMRNAGAANIAASVVTAQTATLVEAMTELVSENRQLLHWADLVQVQRLLAELVRALTAENRIDGLSRAFMAFVGRPIDSRAASEALRLADGTAMFNRLVDLIHSNEASGYLSAQNGAALRHVVDGAREVIGACVGEHIDLFRFNDHLRMPPPTLQDVLLVEDLLSAGVDRIELLVYLAHNRPSVGDALDLFIEVAAGVCRERGPRIVAADADMRAMQAELFGGPGEAPISLPGTKVSNKPDESRQADLLPRSFMRDVPLLSASFGEGWHAVEHGGSRMFRWMMREGVIENPERARPVREVTLDVQGIYGGHEPLLIAWLGQSQAVVQTEAKPDGDGWRVHLVSDGDGGVAPNVRIQALAGGCPALLEGAPDTRELSLCVIAATFMYRD
jgi:glycosyltransferase involved in cell wall biosynthesis